MNIDLPFFYIRNIQIYLFHYYIHIFGILLLQFHQYLSIKYILHLNLYYNHHSIDCRQYLHFLFHNMNYNHKGILYKYHFELIYIQSHILYIYFFHFYQVYKPGNFFRKLSIYLQIKKYLRSKLSI